MEKLSSLPVPEFLERIMTSNTFCVDCNDEQPDWASLGFGILICLKCAGYHRSLGTHVTLVRSLRLDSWSSDQIKYLEVGGNYSFNSYVTSSCSEKSNIVVSENDSMKFDNFQKYCLPDVLYYRELLSSKIEDRQASPYNKSDYDDLITQISSLSQPVSGSGSPQKKSDKVVIFNSSSWIPDKTTNHCMLCVKQFSMFVRRHHCRKCGRVVCSDCAPIDNTRPILEIGMKTPVRHCKQCFKSPIVNWKHDHNNNNNN